MLAEWDVVEKEYDESTVVSSMLQYISFFVGHLATLLSPGVLVRRVMNTSLLVNLKLVVVHERQLDDHRWDLQLLK